MDSGSKSRFNKTMDEPAFLFNRPFVGDVLKSAAPGQRLRQN
jgi:hypothetical protein